MTHDRGAVASAARDTAVSTAEGRLKLDVVDKIFLLEPRLIGPIYSNIDKKGKIC